MEPIVLILSYPSLGSSEARLGTFHVLIMANLARWARSIFPRSVSPLRKFSSGGFKVIGDVEKLEEENWDWYKPGLFYAMGSHISEC